MGRPARSLSPATVPPLAATELRSTKISFCSRKIVKTLPPKPLATAAVAPPAPAPAPAPLPPVLPALSSPGEIAAALRHLQAADPLLSAVIASTEAPTFAASPSLPAFNSLARSILYQQLATSAADAIYARFLALLPSASVPRRPQPPTG
ncbi:putative DNA-3-methyladenine glycosylase 2 [Panicum miliaceum]|uniref:DNA-3-methyladenine glycosylase 2 n=1 Tax=Panicum miliaceum TaxID=4540 RepID=A0A3L6SYE0_PANMI|nr:putative DNA-3-methyladenine glycosylase 2 [Panicum miliaceum]